MQVVVEVRERIRNVAGYPEEKIPLERDYDTN
jgi:hypothetical protein